MKQIEVTILGQNYVLGCPDDGERTLIQAVGSVDREMSAIRSGGKVKMRERIAVLAALNLAFELAERPAGQQPFQATSAALSGAAAVDIDGLIRRIDQALGADGQLL